jgi:hypothetical protein
MYKISFTLKQHTPLIHFQHEQEGATLRATEVKPKLDAYLIEKLNLAVTNALAKVEVKQDYKDWFIADGEQHLALDYKMKIEQSSSSKVTPILYSDTSDGKYKPEFPNLFGNIEIPSEKKQFVFNETDILVTISSFCTELLTEIENNFIAFISQTNFGYRQSKGFGSFSVFGKPVLNANAYFTFDDTNNNNCKSVFEAIELFYKSIRSGVRDYNRSGDCIFYFKSMIVAHYHQSGEKPKWDKAAIKDVLKSGLRSSNGMDVKDLLGLSSNESWVAEFRTSFEKIDEQEAIIKRIGNEIFIERDNRKRKELENKKNNLTTLVIKRFSSPIYFKPIYDEKLKQWKVYLFLRSIPKVYLDSTMIAKVGEGVKLKMWANFKLNEFLKFVCEHSTIEKLESHLENYLKEELGGDFNEFLKHRHFLKLRKVYKTLKLLKNE